MSSCSLDEVLELIIAWEERLNSFYEILEEYLANKNSRKITEMLQNRHKKALDVLKMINVNDYKDTEFIKNVPDFHSEGLIARLEIDVNSSPCDVFETVLRYEERLKEYYYHLREVVVYEKSKDLLNMLIQFKMGQIKEIKALMDDCDLEI